MRWPFFSGRSAAKDSGRPEPRSPLRDWASLPAIQRAVGEPRLTAPTAAFVRSLAGTHDPDLSLEPLGHHVSLDGPSGLVTGLARNVETYAPSHELVARPKPRREAPVQRRLFGSEEAASETLTAEDVETSPAPEPVTMSFPVVDEPVQTSAPLTRISDTQATAVMRLAMPRPPVEASPPAAVREGSRGEAASEVSPRPVTAQRFTLGQSRRLGLGAPISKQIAATVQRSLDDAPLDLAPAPRAPREQEREQQMEIAEEHSVQLPEAADEPATAPSVERIAPLAGAMIQRRTAAEAAGDDEPPPALPLAPATAAGAFEPAPASLAPVMQRVVATPLPPLFSRPAPTPTAPLVAGRPPLLTVRRPSDSVELDAVAGEAPALATVQRLPEKLMLGESHVMSAQPAVRAVLPPAAYREVVTPGAPSLGNLSPFAPRAPLAPLALLAPAVQRLSPPAQDFVAYSPFATSAPAPSGPRGTAVIDVPIQREIAAGEAPAEESGVAAATSAAAAAAGPAAAEAPGQSDKELDELARKLHDRISLHLRRDLLIQRERAGMATDLP